ncbi:SoxR Predicted transcriptional regulators [Fimbriimonadaceae bacterium]
MTGVSADTLRYYEKAGLLDGVSRNVGGHRRFSSADLNGLRFVLKLRMTGMPIRDVRRYVELVRQGEATTDQRRGILQGHGNRIRQQMSELARCLEIVDVKLEMYDLGLSPTDEHDCTKKLASLLEGTLK